MSTTATEILEQPRLACVFVERNSSYGPLMEPEYAKAFQTWLGAELTTIKEPRLFLLYAQFVRMCESCSFKLADVAGCEALVHRLAGNHFSYNPSHPKDAPHVLNPVHEVFEIPCDSPEPQPYHGQITYPDGVHFLEWECQPRVIRLESRTLVVYEYSLRGTVA